MADRRSGVTSEHIVAAFLAGLLPFALATPASAITPDNPGAAAVQFTLDSGQNVKAISPYIYGINGTTLNPSTTADRLGGNRWTGYNWETNASNAGADWYFESDNNLVSQPQYAPYANTPGGALIPSLNDASANNRSLIVTVPMAGYVSADMAGPVPLAMVAPSSRWKEVVPLKSSKYSGAAAALSNSPNTIDDYVFTDEFVNWVETHKTAGQNVFYDLDNEPGLWGEPLPQPTETDPGWQPGVPPCPWCNPPTPAIKPSPEGRTHGELHPYKPTFTELVNKTIDNAAAIKSVNQNAKVFGGVGYGWNDFVSLQDAPDANSHAILPHPGDPEPSGQMKFYEYLLQQLQQADQQRYTLDDIAQGKTLMDVLDLHWYTEARGNDNGGASQRVVGGANQTDPGVVAARVQSTRSLWDTTYTETSWITQYSTCIGHNPCVPAPIKLLPRVQRDIKDFKPGTKIALSEYNFGGANHISGAIAEADALGIFGQQGVFAANYWPVDSNGNSQFASAAFKMFLNYNGSGAKYGDTSVGASTDNIDQSAVYTSIDSSNPNRMVVIAINRTGGALTTGIKVTHDRVFDHAEVYQLTSGGTSPVRAADMELNLLNAFQYTMPAWSVTTLVLISDGLPGDFNHDHVVDSADYTLWRDSVGRTGNIAADANEDNVVNDADFMLWRSNFGRTEPTGGTGGLAAGVPEPPTFTLLALAACGLASARIRRRLASPPRGDQ